MKDLKKELSLRLQDEAWLLKVRLGVAVMVPVITITIQLIRVLLQAESLIRTGTEELVWSLIVRYGKPCLYTLAIALMTFATLNLFSAWLMNRSAVEKERISVLRHEEVVKPKPEPAPMRPHTSAYVTAGLILGLGSILLIFVSALVGLKLYLALLHWISGSFFRTVGVSLIYQSLLAAFMIDASVKDLHLIAQIQDLQDLKATRKALEK